MTWVDLSGAFGYGTKLTSTQQQNLRDNIAAMTAGDAGAPEIVQAALKSTTGEVSLSCSGGGCNVSANHELPGGEYGFYPQTRAPLNTSWYPTGFAQILNIGTGGSSYESFKTWIYLNLTGGAGAVSYYIYAQQRYIQSSGEVNWLFILRNKLTKEIVASWFAPDHPCFGNGGKPNLVCHPFADFKPSKGTFESVHEIIVVNPSHEEMKEINEKTINPSENQHDRSILQVIMDDYGIDESSEASWPTEEVTVKLERNWSEAYLSMKPCGIKKMIIPKPDYVLCKSLKLKDGKVL